ncbi:thioredoxin TrxC [Pelobacter seleniigenes]|uniref:thioredoxin TrxC n=1 Tax=Pelobacter seleniigenes TaxID=407188 RepID=UPI0004A6F6CA|nr:thioredoxin TrxC [Pelobacter seleniigenes]
MSESFHLICPHCQAINRVPENKLSVHPNCGRCKEALFSGRPVELTSATFDRYLQQNDIPLLVDFWAPWCGPCKMMSPAFSEAAKDLEPRVRLAKFNTESDAGIGGRLNIRSIPTLVLFHKGVELARQSGAMERRMIVQWTKAKLG